MKLYRSKTGAGHDFLRGSWRNWSFDIFASATDGKVSVWVQDKASTPASRQRIEVESYEAGVAVVGRLIGEFRAARNYGKRGESFAAVLDRHEPEGR